MVQKKNTPQLAGNELKKYRQKKKILNLLYRHDSMPGSTMSGKIGVSFPTALSLLNELVEIKFVEQSGVGASRGGRKPNLFRLSNSSMFVVACELGRYNAKMAIYNAHSEPVTSLVNFDTSIDDDELVNKIYSTYLAILQNSAVDEKRVLGLGVTMPGLIDEINGINHTIKKAEFRNVKERLAAISGKMVYVNNDARMQAYGEFIFGKAKGYANAINISWSWGIGFGMILDGKLYNGSTGFAGELSHVKMVEDGELCICGKRGCLETVASSNFLMKKAVEGIQQNKVSQLTERYKNRDSELHPEDILQTARAGDEFSILLLNQMGLELGKGLAFSIQLLNPEIIVIGGVLSGANQYILAPIQQALNKYCLEQISSNVKIVISENWEQSGLLGVTAMLFQQLFSDSNSEIQLNFV